MGVYLYNALLHTGSELLVGRNCARNGRGEVSSSSASARIPLKKERERKNKSLFSSKLLQP